MPTLAIASDVLNREFLSMRARLVDLAAALDRIDRAQGSVADDPRMAKIRQAMIILAANNPGRAEQIQLLFSLPYQENWQQQYNFI
jgi:hypothetical protein